MGNNDYEVLDLDQRSAEWLEWRKTRIGASDIPVIMGLNPWKTPYKLWLEKTGRCAEQSVTPAMQRGIDLEPIARDALSKQIGQPLGTIVIQRIDEPWAIASLDAVSFDHMFIAEIKAPNKLTHDATVSNSEIPTYYMAQVQWQIYVTGIPVGHYFSFMDEENNVLIEVKRDHDFIREAREAALEFLECLRTDTPPSMEEKDHVYLEGDDVLRASLDYYEVDKRYAEAKQARDQAKQKLLDVTDGGNCETDHLKITHVYQKGSIDYEAFLRSKGIDVSEAEKFSKGTVHKVLITAKKDKS